MPDPDYLYELTDGSIQRKPARVVEMGCGPEVYFDSPFVRRWWRDGEGEAASEREAPMAERDDDRLTAVSDQAFDAIVHAARQEAVQEARAIFMLALLAARQAGRTEAHEEHLKELRAAFASAGKPEDSNAQD